jgi:hypothetical protein
MRSLILSWGFCGIFSVVMGILGLSGVAVEILWDLLCYHGDSVGYLVSL